MTRRSTNGRWYYTEVAEELLEAITAEDRGEARMLERGAPVHLRARQTIDAHEDMRAQEGIQLCSSSMPPVVWRCHIGVLRELLHQLQRQEILQHLQRRRILRRRSVLQVA